MLYLLHANQNNAQPTIKELTEIVYKLAEITESAAIMIHTASLALPDGAAQIYAGAHEDIIEAANTARFHLQTLTNGGTRP